MLEKIVLSRAPKFIRKLASLALLLKFRLTKRAGGRLKLLRVYEESEVEEVSVGEYQLKNRRR